jgi:hypothetical protein
MAYDNWPGQIEGCRNLPGQAKPLYSWNSKVGMAALVQEQASRVES